METKKQAAVTFYANVEITVSPISEESGFDHARMLATIKKATRARPWLITTRVNNKPRPAKLSVYRYDKVFRVILPVMLKASQLQAFHQFRHGLLEELASMKLPDVHHIDARLNLSGKHYIRYMYDD